MKESRNGCGWLVRDGNAAARCSPMEPSSVEVDKQEHNNSEVRQNFLTKQKNERTIK